MMVIKPRANTLLRCAQTGKVLLDSGQHPAFL
jgi:hypothetical protein